MGREDRLIRWALPYRMEGELQTKVNTVGAESANESIHCLARCVMSIVFRAASCSEHALRFDTPA